MTRLLRAAHGRLSRPLILLALLLTIVGPLAGPTASSASESLRPHVVRLTTPNAAVRVEGSLGAVEDRLRARQRDAVLALLARETAAGRAADASYDSAEDVIRVQLSEAARLALLADAAVAAVEPAPARASAQAAAEQLPPQRSAQAVSSVSFVQVYTPFVWGRTSVNGLSVTLTLEDGSGHLKGVALQTTRTAPNNYVKVDRTQLYFETVFVDPNESTHPTVTIMPGDRVHVVTTGVDPASNRPGTDDRRIIVDDVRAWTSLEQDKVTGRAPAGASLTVTSASTLGLGSYLTPGTSLTYADTTASADGSFTIEKFRTSTSATATKPNFQQGATGFVRVRHSDGNEVYTVHGQSIFVLENSPVVHGWAFPLPTVPIGLETGVALSPRPATPVSATLRGASGQAKDSGTAAVSSNQPYTISFTSAQIAGGDSVEVSIWGAPLLQASAGRLSAAMQLSTNTITGSGPANTQLVLGAGKLQGYVMAQSFFDYLQQRVTTDGSGNFASPQFSCGTTNHLSFRPGSFGYAGYEDPRGNFVYMTFAVPTNQVMVDYPFVEGWVADGTVRPEITIVDPAGATRQQATVTPELIWLTNQKLFTNVYYQLNTSQFISAGDKVVVKSGAWASSIPVDRLTAWLDTDSDSVVGEAPAGATMRVVPASDRASRKELTAGGDGQYRADSPFTQISSGNCADTSKPFDFQPGETGRAYVTHPDNNEVFAVYGRAMHVNQNENYLELYLLATHDLDWDPTPQRTATVTLTPRLGQPVTVQVKADFGRTGKTKVTLLDGQNQRVLIRAGDAITATWDEGPEGLTRPVTMELRPQSLVTGSPDPDTGTLAGVGPRGWRGRAALNPPPTVTGLSLPLSGTSAYAPVRFSSSTGAVQLVRGYSGTVSFSNTTGQRIWTAWAVAAVPVKVSGLVRPGDTRICGTGPASTTLRIHDVTAEGQDTLIATGSVDGSGNWCATVPALTKGQVIVAEADGVYAQPNVIGGSERIFIAVAARGTGPQ